MPKNTSLEPEYIDPRTPANRVKATRIRKALKDDPDGVSPEDALWYKTYEGNQKTSRAASRSHKVSYTEESAESAAEGDPLAVAAAMAAPELAREEGRRYDSLILAAVSAMKTSGEQIRQANEMVLKMAAQILARNDQMETVHIKMLDTIRGMSKSLAEAEADRIIGDAESEAAAQVEKGGGLEGMIREMAPVIMAEWAKRNGVIPGAQGGVPPQSK